MKKSTVLLLAMMLGVTSCGAKKPIAQPAQPAPAPVQQVDPMQAKIDSLEKVKKLRELEREIEKDDAKHEMQMANLNMQERLEEGMKMLLIPCTEEILQLENSETMAAQGIATGKKSEEDAMLDANRVALMDITTRFLGVLKNGIEQYGKDSRAKSGNRGVESQLEGLAVAVGEKEINKQFKVSCRKFTKDKIGNYNCYEALYVQTEKIVEAIIDEAEEEGIAIDKALFRNRMQAELDRQAEKQAAINQQKLENMRAAKEELEK